MNSESFEQLMSGNGIDFSVVRPASSRAGRAISAIGPNRDGGGRDFLHGAPAPSRNIRHASERQVAGLGISPGPLNGLLR